MAKALIAIWGEAKASPQMSGNNYVGIAELSDYGFMRVELHFPYGVNVPQKIPCIIMVDCSDSNAEMRVGKYPLIMVNKWYEVGELYDYSI